MTPLQQFCRKWVGGCGNEICTMARRVLGKGDIPCEIVFIGEAPGESENCLGYPFAGPAGYLLAGIVNEAFANLSRIPTAAYTNLTCCIPREEDGGKAAQPTDDEIKKCGPRLVEFVEICQPRLIVCVGAMARDWLDPKVRPRVEVPREIPQVEITHPAAILRANIAAKAHLRRRAVITLRDAAVEYLEL